MSDELAALPPYVDRKVLREILRRLPADAHGPLLTFLTTTLPPGPKQNPQVDVGVALQAHTSDPQLANLFACLFGRPEDEDRAG